MRSSRSTSTGLKLCGLAAVSALVGTGFGQGGVYGQVSAPGEVFNRPAIVLHHSPDDIGINRDGSQVLGFGHRSSLALLIPQTV